MTWKYVIAGLACLSVAGCSQKSDSEADKKAEVKTELKTEVAPAVVTEATIPPASEVVTKEDIEEKTGSLCDTYAEEASMQLAEYQQYCRTGESPNAIEALFPEYIWCVKLDPPVDCAGAAEQNWCETLGEAKATEQTGLRNKRIDECKQAYETAFGKTGADLAALVPTGQVVVGAEVSGGRLAPIEHDFNGDQHPDRVFVTGTPVNGQPAKEDLRLMVALSSADGTLKTIPVAPLWLSNNEAESSQPQSKIVVDDKGDLRVSTVTVDKDHSDSYSEYRFRFVDGQFVLQQELAGYTEIAYEDNKPEANHTSTVTDYEKGVILKSDTERCDSALNAGNPCPGAEEESVPTDIPRPTLANFLDL